MEMLRAGNRNPPLDLDVKRSPGRGDRKLLSQHFAVQEMNFRYSSIPNKIKYLQRKGNFTPGDVRSGLPAELSDSSL